MPEAFELETPTESGEWIVWGGYEAWMFDRLDDGTYICAGHGRGGGAKELSQTQARR